MKANQVKGWFLKGGETGVPGEKPPDVEQTTNKLNPHMTPRQISLVNGRCHFSERSLPFEKVDAIYNGRLHTSLQRKLKETN